MRGGRDLKEREGDAGSELFTDTGGHSPGVSTGLTDLSHAARERQEPFGDAERELISLTIERVLSALDAGNTVRARDLLSVLLRLVG